MYASEVVACAPVHEGKARRGDQGHMASRTSIKDTQGSACTSEHRPGQASPVRSLQT